MTKYIFDGEGTLYPPIATSIIKEYYKDSRVGKAIIRNAPKLLKYGIERLLEIFTGNRLFFPEKFETYREITEDLLTKFSAVEKEDFARKYILSSKRLQYVLKKIPDAHILTNGISDLVNSVLPEGITIEYAKYKSVAIDDIFIYDGLNDKDVTANSLPVVPTNPVAIQLACGSVKGKKPFKETIDFLLR